MPFFTKPTLDAPPVDASDNRPELWTPPHLAAIYAEVAPAARAALHPLAAQPGWYDDLAGRNSLGSSSRAPLADTVMRGTLAAHLRDALTATQYGGATPGAVDPPPLQMTVYAPLQLSDGTQSRSVMQNQPAHREREEWMQRYKEDQARVPEFVGAVRDTAVEVLSDRERAWEVHVHLTTLDAARREHESQQRAAEAERARLARDQCPICEESDPLSIGPIALRALVPGINHIIEGTPALRSCAVCWNIAAEEHLTKLATTRRHRIMQHLAGLNGGSH